MKKIICDRCKMEDSTYSSGWSNMVDYSSSVDLCPDCYKKWRVLVNDFNTIKRVDFDKTALGFLSLQ